MKNSNNLQVVNYENLLTSLITSRKDLKFWLFILRCSMLIDSTLAKTQLPKKIATHICVTSKGKYKKDFIDFFAKTIENSVSKFSEAEFTKILEKFLQGLSAKQNISITQALDILLYILVQLDKNEFRIENVKHMVNNLFTTAKSAKTQLIEYEIITPPRTIQDFLEKNQRWSDIWKISTEADKQAAQNSRKPRIYTKTILNILIVVAVWAVISVVFFYIGMKLFLNLKTQAYESHIFAGMSGASIAIFWAVITLTDQFQAQQNQYKLQDHQEYVEKMEKTIDDILNNLVNLKIEKLLTTVESETKTDIKSKEYYINMELNQNYLTTSQILLNLDGVVLPKRKVEKKPQPHETPEPVQNVSPKPVNVTLLGNKIDLLIYPKLKILNNNEKKTVSPITFVSAPGTDKMLSYFPYHTLKAIFQSQLRKTEFNKFEEFAKNPKIGNDGYRKLTDGIERTITAVIDGQGLTVPLEWEMIRGGINRLLAFELSANGFTVLVPICLHDLHTNSDKNKTEFGKVTIAQKDLEKLFCKAPQTHLEKSEKEEASDEEPDNKTLAPAHKSI